MKRIRIIFKALALSLVCLFPLTTLAAPSVRVTIIDRGQADGILIKTPNSDWVVIDAGTNRQQALSMRDHWNVDEVDLAIVTHRHRDHQDGMDDVINLFPPKRFIGVMEDCPNRKGDDKVRTALANHNITAEPLSNTTQEYTIDGVKFTVFPLPARSPCPEHENLNSIVVRMDYGEFSMLFTGDAEEEALGFLVTNYQDLLDVDVLKASHHGSNNGYTDNFLAAVSPGKVVISAGVNATYKHPMAEAVAAYKTATNNKVYCTNRHQTLRIYGKQNGTSRIYRQNRINKSCVYDGTHY